jgi:hypothetical protein
MKPFNVIFFVFLVGNLIAQTPEEIFKKVRNQCKTGSIQEYKENTGVIIEIPVTRGAGIPKKFSLKEFVPEIKQQEGSSCACYSTAYYGFTTYERYTEKNKLLPPYDPLYLYARNNVFYNVDDTVDGGTNPMLNLIFLRDYGNPRVESDEFLTECNDPLAKYPDRLNKWENLNNNYSNLDKIKYSISSGSPVNVSLSTNFSFDVYAYKFYLNSELISRELLVEYLINSEYSESFNADEIGQELDKLNKLNAGEEYCWSGKPPKENEGSHSVCIIGYDDDKFGGAFEIVNSWGTEWANDGYLWIKYKDLYKMYPTFYKIGK